MNKQLLEDTLRTKRAKLIYEATRIEAGWSGRSIVPEKWERRDNKFREQFVEIIDKYLSLKRLPTPTEAHNSWMDAYFKMGWKYGKERNTEKKTHPDLLPFDQLPKDERDKDAVFLAFVWVTAQLLSEIEKALLKQIVKKEETEDFKYFTYEKIDGYLMALSEVKSIIHSVLGGEKK